MPQIVKFDHPALKMVADEIPFGEDVRDLASEMLKEMRTYGGVGLAANQINVLKRIIVLDIGGIAQVIVNPVITGRSKQWCKSNEGCLSFPGHQYRVDRRKGVTVTGYDEDWHPVKIRATGLRACCLQHEIDHLNGITLPDSLR